MLEAARDGSNSALGVPSDGALACARSWHEHAAQGLPTGQAGTRIRTCRVRTETSSVPRKPRPSKPKTRTAAALPDRSGSPKAQPLRGDRSSGKEWVGGIFATTVEIEEHPGAHPDVLVWIERPVGTIVGAEPRLPGNPDTHLGTVLLRCMEAPATGAPRRPASIRVASADLAAEVRSVIGDSIPVQVAPTPEIDDAQRHLEPLLDEPGDGGLFGSVGPLEEDLPEPVIAEFFRALAAMARVRPWAVMYDCLLRLDVPDLDVDGACVNLIDASQGCGMLIFPSLEAQISIEANWGGDHPDLPPGADLGSGWLALAFASRDEVPALMREEIDRCGWKVAGRRWYPVVQSFDRFGMPIGVTEGDLRVVTAAALASTALLPAADGSTRSHRRPFDGPELVEVSDRDGNDIYLSGPWDEYDLPGPGDPGFYDFVPVPTGRKRSTRPKASGSGSHVGPGPIATGFGAPIPRVRRKNPTGFQPRASRNAPCPCGSGKKYKKCCLNTDLAGSETTHERDRRLIDEMQEFAFEVLGVTWSDMTKDFIDADDAAGLAMDWSVYVAEIKRRPVVDWFFASARPLSKDDRRWLAAQQRSWLSVWEVRKVDPGKSLLLGDALTGIVEEVEETLASQQLQRGDQVLARLVEFDGTTTVSGFHPRRLPLVPAFEVVEDMHRYLHRKRSIRPEQLLPHRVARRLLTLWEEAVLAVDAGMFSAEIAAADPRSLARSHKRNHYAGWPDLPMPALDNETPREAVASAEGRRRVAALLDEMEKAEQKEDPETAFDFGELRAKLGLGQ